MIEGIEENEATNKKNEEFLKIVTNDPRASLIRTASEFGRKYNEAMDDGPMLGQTIEQHVKTVQHYELCAGLAHMSVCIVTAIQNQTKELEDLSSLEETLSALDKESLQEEQRNSALGRSN